MKRAIKKAIQAITLAVLVAGASMLIAGSEETGEASASNVCYGYDCRCDEQRRDSIAVATRKRDKDFSRCTNPLCFEQVNSEYKARLAQIQRNYQLCLSHCIIDHWPVYWLSR